MAKSCRKNLPPVNPDDEQFLTYEGRERRYVVHKPRDFDGTRKLPVVLAFHGGSGRAEAQRIASRLDQVADRFGFLAVFPDGTGRAQHLMWNAGICCGYAVRHNVDDVGFVGKILDELPTQYPVDLSRGYATGMSNGAMICYRLALELSDRICAIAPVAGGMGIEAPPPPRPVPLIHFHGHKDPNAHFHGGKGPILGVPHPSIPNVIAWWVRANHCQLQPAEVHRDRDLIRTTYVPASGQSGAPVVLCELPDGGHTWPGGVDLTARLGTGNLIESVDASTIMWEFFQQFALPGFSEVVRPQDFTQTDTHP